MSERHAYDEIGAAIAARTQDVRAPEELRARIGRTRARRSRTTRVGAAALAAAVLAAILVFAGGAGPSVQDVAVAALNAPTQAAPPIDRGDDSRLDLQVDGLAFPSLERRWDWEAIGARQDEVGGRSAVTVIYRKGERGVHYTIVEGDPLPRPDGARVVRSDGTTFAITREAGARVVSWELAGHTCVLASQTLDAAELIRLASW